MTDGTVLVSGKLGSVHTVRVLRAGREPRKVDVGIAAAGPIPAAIALDTLKKPAASPAAGARPSVGTAAKPAAKTGGLGPATSFDRMPMPTLRAEVACATRCAAARRALRGALRAARVGAAGPRPVGRAGARGPTPDDKDKKEQARALFDKGLRLYNEGAFDAALVEFQRSREIFPTRSATQNAGLALRKLHRFDEAFDMLELLLKDFPNLKKEDRDLVEREITDLRGLIGEVEVSGAEVGATVVVDGRPRGTTPLSAPIRVAAGTHILRATKEGFAPFERRIQVAGGEKVKVVAKLGALIEAGRLQGGRAERQGRRSRRRQRRRRQDAVGGRAPRRPARARPPRRRSDRHPSGGSTRAATASSPA